MSFKTVTVKDIAKALKMSASTVSRALRDRHEISTATKQRVIEYARKMNYQPNPAALQLKEKRTRFIGIVVSQIDNNFLSQAIHGIEAVANSRGYHVVVTQTLESNTKEKSIVNHLASRGVDGILISPAGESMDLSHITEFINKGLPFVFFDRVVENVKAHKVVLDNYAAAFNATNHLIQQGFRNIAHLTSALHISTSKERLQGFKEALTKHKLPVNEELIKQCSFGGLVAGEIRSNINALFLSSQKPDAILCGGDRITTTSFDILKTQKKIDKIGFAGFTNTEFAHLFHPAVTTVHQPAMEMAEAATEMLISTIESRHPIKEFETRKFDASLIIRDSSLKKKN